ncbi:MAG TPA: hypothetical protein DIV41_06625, partial [Ruminococcaceae bacterium]|nr:hypothetical protein [Oscillospiraceae bacterium]
KVLICGMYGGKADFFTAKGMAEDLLCRLSVYGWEIKSSGNESGYHPGRCAVLTVGGEKLGVIGEIHPEV